MKHSITNARRDTLIGDCSICGPEIRVQWNQSSGTYRCVTAYRTGNNAAYAKKVGGLVRPNHGIPYNERRIQLRYGDEAYAAWKIATGCKICGSPDIAVDHCHERNTFRGILCRKCNAGLGMFNDNVELLRRAIAYLEAAWSSTSE